MPRLWSATIEAHRREVHDAILDTTATLAAEQGLLSVTMSQIAETTGIGRATLYKYFPDVEAILVAWHERQISGHLEQLAKVRDQGGTAHQRLEAVLELYASIQHALRAAHATDLAAHLHGGKHVAQMRRQLLGLVRELIATAAEDGTVRGDVTPDELATYCLHALAAASDLPSKTAIRRLVQVTMAGLQPSA
ncbi:MAG: TetR/AcrR family transcriptional regulator [Candidatus Dormibacteraeota bacterium]|nr:TetR/AcrR family transcriptional regulator [Candidatus Dormibacteraeota bacterium]